MYTRLYGVLELLLVQQFYNTVYTTLYRTRDCIVHEAVLYARPVAYIVVLYKVYDWVYRLIVKALSKVGELMLGEI